MGLTRGEAGVGIEVVGVIGDEVVDPIRRVIFELNGEATRLCAWLGTWVHEDAAQLVPTVTAGP